MKKIFQGFLILVFLVLAFLVYIAYTQELPQQTPDSNTEDLVFSLPEDSKTVYSADNPYRIAVIGDFGDPSPSPADQVADVINNWHVDAIVTTGDNAYPNGSMSALEKSMARYQSFVASKMFFPTLGNHDWWKGYPGNLDEIYTADSLPSSQYFSYLPGNKRYYSEVLGNGLVKIVSLSTDYREPDLSNQGSFAQSQLNGNEKFKFVFTHEPPYSSCDGKSSSRSEFDYHSWGVSAVFSGHCHLYERLFNNGLYYFVQGAGGGGQTDKFGQTSPFSQFRYNNDKGVIIIELTDTLAKVYFINTSGTIIDSVEIPSLR